MGFGDITPETDVARPMVTVQMLVDLFVGVVALELILGAATRGIDRQKKKRE